MICFNDSGYRRRIPERQPVDKAPLRSEHEQNNHRTSRPLKISNDEPMRNSSTIKEKRYDHDSKYYYDDDRRSMYNMYSYRSPSDYDSMYFY